MQTLIASTQLGIKVNELAGLGRLAKDVIKIENREALLNEIYMRMAHICNEIRSFEYEFKVAYPMLADLYDNLIALYDISKNKE